ncbi:MAG TPA: hypothetical protein VFV34_04050, partial [Blastocatellia bacterium]|nr:hypothetical protein [Blastocatellia bacterium]
PSADKSETSAAVDAEKREAATRDKTVTSEPHENGEPKATAPSAAEASTPHEQAGDPQGQLANKQTSKEDGSGDSSIAGAAVAEAAKAAPQLSAQLLKKAAELRANKLSEADIKQLAQAAKDLSRDLEKLASSKELQQAAEQVARSIDPAQIEQLARELANQEDLRRELQAAARLMTENREARDTIAGFAQQAAEIGERFEQSAGRSGAGRETDRGGFGKNGSRSGQPGSSGLSGTDAAGPSSQKINSTASARDDARADGLAAARSGGLLRANEKEEKLYVKPTGGVVAARVPYSTAYPGYRREAERSVERTQVPARLRSLVQTYFDSINPDVRRTQGRPAN